MTLPWKTFCVLSFAVGAISQSSNVTCDPVYEWAFNSRNQSPCLVSSYLQSVCGQLIAVNEIPEQTHYLGPTLSQASVCTCNTVVYSLTSACGACQGRATSLDWRGWSVNCPDSAQTVGRFPRPIPDGTEVPQWANVNVTEWPGQRWDPIRARLAADQFFSSTTFSTAQTGPTTASNPPPDPSSSSVRPGISLAPADPGPSSSNAGAIAGGVVGGLVFLVSLGLLIFWILLWKKRKAETAPPKDFVIDDPHSAPLTASSPPPLSQRSGTTPLSHSIYNHSFDAGVPAPMSPRPGSVIHTTITTRRSQESFHASQFGSQMASGRPNGYTGVAEV